MKARTVNCHIPFDTGEHPVRISQGFHGPWSHKDWEGERMDLSHAIDFNLPYGTEITPCMRGWVSEIIDSNHDYYEGDDPIVGLRTPVNLVIIDHRNGLLSIYSHLEPDNPFIKEKKYVEYGDIIGRTGESGWTGGEPHLHFQVHETINGFIRTLPICFENYKGPLEHAQIYGQNGRDASSSPIPQRERIRNKFRKTLFIS